jgi:hypothetical protein
VAATTTAAVATAESAACVTASSPAVLRESWMWRDEEERGESQRGE